MVKQYSIVCIYHIFGLEVWGKQHSTCLTSAKPWVQTPVLPKSLYLPLCAYPFLRGWTNGQILFIFGYHEHGYRNICSSPCFQFLGINLRMKLLGHMFSFWGPNELFSNLFYLHLFILRCWHRNVGLYACYLSVPTLCYNPHPCNKLFVTVAAHFIFQLAMYKGLNFSTPSPTLIFIFNYSHLVV
jgi:hypothetical protein